LGKEIETGIICPYTRGGKPGVPNSARLERGQQKAIPIKKPAQRRKKVGRVSDC